MLRSLYIAAFLAFGIFPAAAYAAPWIVDAAQSKLQFSGTQAGDPFVGGFAKFTAVIAFDPAHPQMGKIDVTVDISSGFVANDKDKNAALLTDEWFAAAKFPSAEFHSTAIRATTPNHYEADGTLTLRGISKPITLAFALEPSGSATKATGSVTLKRNDFGIGQGKEWSSDQWIAYPVAVNFTIVATPAK